MSQFWFHGLLLWTLSNLVLEISKGWDYTASLDILFQWLHSCSCWQDDSCVILIQIFLLTNLILQFCPTGHSWAQKRKNNFCEIDIEKNVFKKTSLFCHFTYPFYFMEFIFRPVLVTFNIIIFSNLLSFSLLLITEDWFHPSLPQPTVLYLVCIKLLCTLFFLKILCKYKLYLDLLHTFRVCFPATCCLQLTSKNLHSWLKSCSLWGNK